MGRTQIRRGVVLLPSLFTLGNLFCGFFALMEASRGRWAASPEAQAEALGRAALFVILAIVLDGLDGRIARLAQATSPMGIQLDSLADVVSFGVAPACLVHSWALAALPRPQLGLGVAFLFAGCGALRLARFNVQAALHVDSRYFVGLPIPGAAAVLAALAVARPQPLTEPLLATLVAGLTVMLSLLMVSRIRYPSLKQVDFARRQPVRALLWVVLVLALVASFPEVSFVAAAFGFAGLGPLGRLLPVLRLAPRSDAAAAGPRPERPQESPRGRP